MGGSGGGNHADDRPRCQQGALRSRWQESPPQTSATSRPPWEAEEQDWGASGRGTDVPWAHFSPLVAITATCCAAGARFRQDGTLVCSRYEPNSCSPAGL